MRVRRLAQWSAGAAAAAVCAVCRAAAVTGYRAGGSARMMVTKSTQPIIGGAEEGTVVGGAEEGMLARTSRVTMEKRDASMREKRRCEVCFMSKSLCVCKRVREIWAKVPSRPKCRIAIFYHYKEWGRASNTGKLLQIGLGSEFVDSFIYGNPEHEASLSALLTSRPSAILFPGPNSVPISSILESLNSDSDADTATATTAATPTSGPAVLCVLDATWTQAPTLSNALPAAVPRVALDQAVSRPSEFLNRKQSTPTRISTVEAAALALEQLGEPKAVVDAIHASLRVSVDSVLLQAGKSKAFSTDVKPDPSALGGVGPFTPPTVEKPVVCPLCNAEPERGYRNLGIRRPWDEERNCKGTSSHRVWKCSGCEGIFNTALK